MQIDRQRPVSVVFTGQLREKELFEKNLGTLSALPCVQELILSTWHRDALENAAYLKQLEQKYGLKVVTATDPALPFDRFNGFRQSVSLRRGLEAVGKADYVFKTRTDCYIDGAALAYLAQKDMAITDPQALAMGIFREKVSVVSASVLAPFYIDDKLVFGHIADMFKLCSMEFSEFKYPSSAKFGHYIRFYPAFMRDFPQFLPFIRHEILVTSSNEDFRVATLPKLLSCREVALPLLVYYRIMSAFFCLDWDGHAPWFRGETAAHLDPAGEVGTNADLQCASNAFFALAAQGHVANVHLAGALREAASMARAVGDPRHIGNGMDLTGFWGRALDEAKVFLQYEDQVAGARQLMREREVQEAFKNLTRLLPCDPSNKHVRYLIALCFHAVGDNDGARIYLHSCLELGDGYDTPAGKLLAEIEGLPAA
ncbi:hypothetical protein ASD15_24450 [Massilia sp. Root351]|uniref:WavE lipopolysaccharide synthesis family protein n=1 Tax=Massilia sp. Root351 TaxID=1736522 RepID=UPI00070D6857|nr:WavE lipopolysaccharide synthesis family protein [Massilia sp. Root351]KQV89859.1 hypothetical protein ASD15_24450 [Massilia sp. Root351]